MAPAPQEHTGTGVSPNDKLVNMNGANAPGLGIKLQRCISQYVCMYVGMRACLCMCVGRYACMHVCIYVWSVFLKIRLRKTFTQMQNNQTQFNVKNLQSP